MDSHSCYVSITTLQEMSWLRLMYPLVWEDRHRLSPRSESRARQPFFLSPLVGSLEWQPPYPRWTATTRHLVLLPKKPLSTTMARASARSKSVSEPSNETGDNVQPTPDQTMKPKKKKRASSRSKSPKRDKNSNDNSSHAVTPQRKVTRPNSSPEEDPVSRTAIGTSRSQEIRQQHQGTLPPADPSTATAKRHAAPSSGSAIITGVQAGKSSSADNPDAHRPRNTSNNGTTGPATVQQPQSRPHPQSHSDHGAPAHQTKRSNSSRTQGVDLSHAASPSAPPRQSQHVSTPSSSANWNPSIGNQGQIVYSPPVQHNGASVRPEPSTGRAPAPSTASVAQHHTAPQSHPTQPKPTQGAQSNAQPGTSQVLGSSFPPFTDMTGQTTHLTTQLPNNPAYNPPQEQLPPERPPPTANPPTPLVLAPEDPHSSSQNDNGPAIPPTAPVQEGDAVGNSVPPSASESPSPSGTEESDTDSELSLDSGESDESSTSADLSPQAMDPTTRLTKSAITALRNRLSSLTYPGAGVKPEELFCNEDWALAGSLKMMEKWALDRSPQLQAPFALSTWIEIIRHFVKKYGALPFIARYAATNPTDLFPEKVATDGSLPRNQIIALWEGCCSFLVQREAQTKRVQISAPLESKELNEARFDFVFLPTPDGGSLTSRMQATISHIVENLDSRMKILPWYNSDTSKPLRGSKALPPNSSILSNFFPGIDTTITDRRVYIQVRLLLHIPPTMILTNQRSRLAGWGRLANMQIYKKPLSTADDPVDIGWLAYTGNFTNADELATLFQQINSDNPGVEIGFRNKKLNIRPNGEQARRRHTAKGGNWRNQPWFCIHVICNRQNIDRATDVLYDTFNTPSADRPFPLHYWFVPFSNIIPLSADEAHSVARVIPHHDRVVSDFKFLTSDEVVSLDRKIKGITLREKLLQITSEHTGKQLIHSVDTTTSLRDASSTVIFTVSSLHYQEAQQIISFLPLHMTQDDPQFRAWFLDTGVLSDPNITWDEESKSFSTKSSKYIQNLHEETATHFILPPEMVGQSVTAPEDIELSSFSNALRRTSDSLLEEDSSVSTSSTIQSSASTTTQALRIELAELKAKFHQITEGTRAEIQSDQSSRSSHSTSASSRRAREENIELRQQMQRMQEEMAMMKSDHQQPRLHTPPLPSPSLQDGAPSAGEPSSPVETDPRQHQPQHPSATHNANNHQDRQSSMTYDFEHSPNVSGVVPV